MKILVISNLYPPHGIGGYEERCKDCVTLLRQRGHDVTVLTSVYRKPQTDGAANPHEDAQSEANGAGTVLRQLQPHGFFGYDWLPVHRLYRLERHNQKVLRNALADVQPDVVHVWNMGGISKSLLHTLECGSIPVVYDISDHWIARSLAADVWLDWWNGSGSAARSALRRLLNLIGAHRWLDKSVPTAPVSALRFAHIYFCSAFLRDLTAQRGYPVAHGTVIHCGIHPEPFARKPTYSPPRKLLWVGRMAPDKDPLTAIEGFLLARDKTGLPLQLDLYGRGDDAYVTSLKARIKQAGAEKAIAFRATSREQMTRIYAQYDALIFSSNWGEPFALTPLEAMASGLPVVMCPDGGDAELLRDGENAIGFTAADPQSLCDGLLRLLALPDHGAAMATLAYNEVISHYSATAMTDKIESMLMAAISA